MQRTYPNRLFRIGCLVVGILYVLLAASMLVRPIETNMEAFGVPAQIMASPYYVDAMTWVYVHMTVLGISIATVGWWSESLRMQRRFCAVMIAAHLTYLAMDLRTSDSVFGNGLYQGPESVIPALIGLGVLIFFVFAFAALLRRPA